MWVKEANLIRQRIRENLLSAFERVCKCGNVYSIMQFSDYLQKNFCEGNNALIQFGAEECEDGSGEPVDDL